MPWPDAITVGNATAEEVAALVAVLFDRWIRHEETNLSRLFGDDYARYRSTTSRWLGKLVPPP